MFYSYHPCLHSIWESYNWTVFEGANNLTVRGTEQKTIIKWKALNNTCMSLDKTQSWRVIIVSLGQMIPQLRHHICSTLKSLKGASEDNWGFNKDWKEDLSSIGEKVGERWQFIWEFKPERLNRASNFASWNCSEKGWNIFQIIQKFTVLSLNLQILALWQSQPQIRGLDKHIGSTNFRVQMFFYQLCSQQDDRRKNFQK